MKRREFITLASGAAVAWPVVARGQQPHQRQLVGWLGGSSRQIATRNLDAFLQGLREHGHEDGKTIDILYRWADGDVSRQPALAKELVELKPNVIMTANGPGTIAARQATASIPIVGALIVDPMKLGLAESHNRPGLNVTGVLQSLEGLPGKQLGMLLEIIPRASTIGVLLNPVNASNDFMLQDIRTTVGGSVVKIVLGEARKPSEIETAFSGFRRNQIDGLIVLQDAMFFTEAAQIISLAAAAKVPAIHGFRQHVENGGLMSYAVDIPQSFRRAAYFVARILKGERAGDLPLELPTKLELVINLKAAKALGLEIPSKLLFTADEVIE